MSCLTTRISEQDRAEQFSESLRFNQGKHAVFARAAETIDTLSKRDGCNYVLPLPHGVVLTGSGFGCVRNRIQVDVMLVSPPKPFKSRKEVHRALLDVREAILDKMKRSSAPPPLETVDGVKALDDLEWCAMHIGVGRGL